MFSYLLQHLYQFGTVDSVIGLLEVYEADVHIMLELSINANLGIMQIDPLVLHPKSQLFHSNSFICLPL